MTWLGIVVGIVLIVAILLDAFEVMILPRRVRHGYRLSRTFYRYVWVLWRQISHLLPAGKWRQSFLSVFGPFSLFMLLVIWATGLIIGFGLLHWSNGTPISGKDQSFG